MTISADNLFTRAILSEAAYVNFIGDDGNIVPDILARIKEKLLEKGFSDHQANDFFATWEIVHQQPNTGTGFSATLFRIGADFFQLASNSLSGGAPCLR